MTRVRIAACTTPSATAGRISAPTARAGFAQPGKPPAGNEPQRDREHDHHQDRQPEIRHREADLGHAHHDRVARAAAPVGGVDAGGERDRRRQRHRHGGERQADREARADQRRDRRAVGVGDAEIAARESRDPARVADVKRQVEAELVGERRHRLRRRGRPEHRLGRVAGKDLHDGEHDQRRDDQRRRKDREPLKEIEQPSPSG